MAGWGTPDLIWCCFSSPCQFLALGLSPVSPFVAVAAFLSAALLLRHLPLLSQRTLAHALSTASFSLPPFLIAILTSYCSHCFLLLAPSGIQVWYLSYWPDDTSLCSFDLLCSTSGTPSGWLPAAPAHGLSSSSLCYFSSGTFLLDFGMQAYI